MQEHHDRTPSSSHAFILSTITSTSHASSTNGKSTEHSLPITTRPRYMVIETDEPHARPDMVTSFRRLYMPEQFKDTATTIQQTQDQYAIKNMQL